MKLNIRWHLTDILIDRNSSKGRDIMRFEIFRLIEFFVVNFQREYHHGGSTTKGHDFTKSHKLREISKDTPL